MVVWLGGSNLAFPDPRDGTPGNGLFAIGGDISPQRLKLAYKWGIIPWYSFHESAPHWYCPMKRCVIFPREIHISRSMSKLIKKDLYSVTMDKDFEGVVRGCSIGSTGENRIEMDGAWLGEEMIQTMLEMHRLGLAHSIEVRDRGNNLVGGLYGILSGNIFCAESMYSRVPSASKIALIALAEIASNFRAGEGALFRLIDCQFPTPHLLSMGARMISYAEYLSYNFLALPPKDPGYPIVLSL